MGVADVNGGGRRPCVYGSHCQVEGQLLAVCRLPAGVRRRGDVWVWGKSCVDAWRWGKDGVDAWVKWLGSVDVGQKYTGCEVVWYVAVRRFVCSCVVCRCVRLCVSIDVWLALYCCVMCCVNVRVTV